MSIKIKITIVYVLVDTSKAIQSRSFQSSNLSDFYAVARPHTPREDDSTPPADQAGPSLPAAEVQSDDEGCSVASSQAISEVDQLHPESDGD